MGHGWHTSHPTTLSKEYIILIYHYLHAVYRPPPQGPQPWLLGLTQCGGNGISKAVHKSGSSWMNCMNHPWEDLLILDPWVRFSAVLKLPQHQIWQVKSRGDPKNKIYYIPALILWHLKLIKVTARCTAIRFNNFKPRQIVVHLASVRVARDVCSENIVVPRQIFGNPRPMWMFPTLCECSLPYVNVPHPVLGFPVEPVAPSKLDQTAWYWYQ